MGTGAQSRLEAGFPCVGSSADSSVVASDPVDDHWHFSGDDYLGLLGTD
jgi:hypothetical protein